MKKIAILTGGGDCAGINSFIAAAVEHGMKQYQAEFVGIRKAFEGASADNLEAYLVPLNLQTAAELLDKPSTILASSRYNPFAEAEVTKGAPEKLISNFQKIGITGVLATGGNDTLKSCLTLAQRGIPVLAAPKSIDNDVTGTDVMLGYKSAISFGTQAVKSAAQSAKTHHRISIVEIMGRDAGWLTLEIGMATGADLILIPEKSFTLAHLVEEVRKIYTQQGYVNIVVAEGVRLRNNDAVLEKAKRENSVIRALLDEERGYDQHGNLKLGGIGQILRRLLRLELNLKSLEEVRTSDLGFILRGLTPVAEDIILGRLLGIRAVDWLAQGVSGQMLGLQGTKILPVDLTKALQQRLVDWDDALLKSVNVLF